MSSDRLKQLKERSKLRRQLLAQQFGTTDEKDFSSVLGKQEGINKAESATALNQSEGSAFAKTPFGSRTDLTSGGQFADASPHKKSETPGSSSAKKSKQDGGDKSEEKGIGEEDDENVYTDSKTFLKGTHSENPHNDYCQHFVDTGHRPHNFIRDTGIADRFEEYPKLKELIRLKDEIIAQRATPPMYLQCDLETFDLTELQYQFDVCMIDPPLEEYQRRCPGLTFNWSPWRWDEIVRLNIGQVVAQRGFCFLWCGSAEGLDEGRKCLKSWGFRRCEDICWIKTNKLSPGNTKYMEPDSVMQHTKEHCLMGIKGTVRRSTDGDFIHANVDLDIIISEEEEYGSMDKPEEIFKIIEHFCLGRRRLHVFGNDHTLRPGWVTVGPDLTSSNYSAEQYHAYFSQKPEDCLVGSTDTIEQLRPKSPPANKKGGGRGRGRGDGDKGRGGFGGRNFNQRPGGYSN